MDFEQHNHQEIERLNQRGGRTLSIVDLIQAGTINVEVASYAMRAMAEGASLLTGARPGGAGKTTLMAALLGLLPPDVPIITADEPSVIREAGQRPADVPACYLVHEIGSGHWYGYLWGQDVARFLSLVDGRRRVASCLHADDLEELTDVLCSPPLEVSRQALARVGLILFMHVSPDPRGYRRRVARVWEADGHGGHRQLFRWNEACDTFEPTGQPARPEELVPYRRFLQGLLDQNESRFEAVRRSVLGFYERR